MRIQPSKMNTYLQSISPVLRDAKFPMERINLSKLEGIQNDIPLFKNTGLEDIKFLTKWFQVLNLARGCQEQCTFCLRNALAPLKENANQISTILWEDLTRFTEGFSKLSERLGVNILQGNSHITLFEDANLPVVKINDTQGGVHNVREACQNVYEKLGLPLVLVTSGWNSKDKFIQQSAEELCSFIQNNPQSVKEFAISVNPFYPTSKETYIEKVANALKTFLPLYKDNTEIGSILLKYKLDNYEEAKSLYEEIFAKLKEITDSNLEGYSTLEPKRVTLHREDNLIENKGRGQRFFTPEEVQKNNKKLFVESFGWLTMSADEKRDFAYNFMTKNVDINGSVYLITPSEQLVTTDIQLDYLNKDKLTSPIHSDIKFTPLKSPSFRGKIKSEFLELPHKEIYSRIKTSLQNPKNKLGRGGMAEVWKIDGTDLCVRIPHDSSDKLNSGFTTNVTRQEKINHTIAKLAEKVTIMPVIKGFTFLSENITDKELAEYVEQMPSSAFEKLFNQVMEAHYAGLKFDSGWKNIIINSEDKTLTAIDFYKPFDDTFSKRMLNEIFLSISSNQGTTDDQRKLIAGKLLLAPVNILENNPNSKIDLQECGFDRFITLLSEKNLIENPNYSKVLKNKFYNVVSNSPTIKGDLKILRALIRQLFGVS